jgi:soluble lytic murein transglycosylase
VPPLPTAPASWDSDARVAAARRLLEAGFTTWASDHLTPAVNALTGRSTREDEALAGMLLQVGAIREARRLVSARCPSKPPETPLSVERLCRATPEADLVGAVTAHWELEPLLPNAIMLAESGFDARATSPAGARGLMQLMPERAATLHPMVFAPSSLFNADDLYRPAYNATLASTELGRLSRVFANTGDTRLPATIAAYNAGEEPVLRWLAEKPGVDADEFAEDIGYTETRQYVRRVLGYLMGYRRTYGDAR